MAIKYLEPSTPDIKKDILPAMPEQTSPGQPAVSQEGTTRNVGITAQTGETVTPNNQVNPTVPTVKDPTLQLLSTGTEGEEVVASSDPVEWKAGTAGYKDQAATETELKFLTDVESVKESQLGARKNIEKNAADASQSYDMLKYANNQTIEKMGWTGGSYTDLKSMESYIKATIAADMYGQVELLKYGYKTELAKAVAAKEANLASLEYQYMQQAFQNNLALSQQTGVWIHPMIENDMGQLSIAEDIMTELEAKPSETWTDAERSSYQRAQGIVGTISEWYLNSDTPLTTEGITALKDLFKEQGYYNDVTLTAIQMESLSIESENAERLANQSYSANEFAEGRVVDAQGNLVVDLNSNNYADITSYFESNPGQWKEWVLNKFELPIQSSFAAFKEANPDSTITTIGDYIAANPDLLADALEYAKNAGQTKITIGDKVYNVEGGTTTGGDTGNEGDVDDPIEFTENDPYIVDGTGQLIDNPDYIPNTDDTNNYFKDDARGIIEQDSSILVKSPNGGTITFDKNFWTLDEVIAVVDNPRIANKNPYADTQSETFGENITEFASQFKQGWEQTDFTNGVIELAKQGLLPDDMYINLNYGQGDSKYLWYKDGRFFEVSGGIPANESNILRYNNYGELQGMMMTMTGDPKTVGLTATTKSSDFGSFSGNGSPTSDQNKYVNTVIGAAREGILPNYTIINMNYGYGDASYYVWANGTFYKVKDSDRIPSDQYSSTATSSGNIDGQLEGWRAAATANSNDDLERPERDGLLVK